MTCGVALRGELPRRGRRADCERRMENGAVDQYLQFCPEPLEFCVCLRMLAVSRGKRQVYEY